MTTLPGDVFAQVVGQPAAVAVLRAAALDAMTENADPDFGHPGSVHPGSVHPGTPTDEPTSGAAAGRGAMTHAWMVTGPPGSGRSVAALAFAAALQCERGGCGQCSACRSVLAGTHPDVNRVVPEGLSLSIKALRDLVPRSAMAPALGRRQVILIEDADRIRDERTWGALLKAIEEPPPRSVWLLCAPGTEDLPPTVRSRCRHVALRAPDVASVAALLEARDGIDAPLARWAASAAGGHIGRARRLASDEAARRRREEVLSVPSRLRDPGAAVVAAANLVEAAEEEATAALGQRHEAEADALREQLGGAGGGRAAQRALSAALRELEAEQKSRVTRAKRDALDMALTDLTSWFRDVLVTSMGADVALVCSDRREEIERAARHTPPEVTLRRLTAVLACRDAVGRNVAPLLAVEQALIACVDAGRRQ